MNDIQEEMDRGETGIRILYTLLFWVITQVIGTVLGLLVLFELIFVLITQRPPPERVREFANRAVSYFYRIGRYVTYNEAKLPFPFAEFPLEIERPGRVSR